MKRFKSALLSTLIVTFISGAATAAKRCDVAADLWMQALFPNVASGPVSIANPLVDCPTCEREMNRIRSNGWSPGPPPEGDWCSATLGGIAYCREHCPSCQVCKDWQKGYCDLGCPSTTFNFCGSGAGVEPCGLTYDGGYTNACDCDPEDPLCASPILIDVAGDGYQLTSVPNGVRFDIRANGTPLLTSWTAAGSDDGWLALDRDGNGSIDNGAELFGNFTPQSAAFEKNGFAALADYDKPGPGGNGDGFITSADLVFASLRVWRDVNHDGQSQPAELSPLAAVGIQLIDLDYKMSQRRDAHGNLFRYRTKLNGSRSAWDVFLIHE